MRYAILFIALILILTGCTTQPVADAQHTDAEPTEAAPSAVPEQTPQETDSAATEYTYSPYAYNLDELLASVTEGIYEENSLFSNCGALRGEPELGEGGYIPPHLRKIYRTFEPANNADSVFETLTEMIEVGVYDYFGYVNYYAIGDVFVPYLLTEESINTSDEELFEKLFAITEARVFSKQDGDMNYRLIAISEIPPSRYFGDWLNWHYFVQVWDENGIRAQPLCESAGYYFGQAMFITAPDGKELLLLCGYTERPGGEEPAFAVSGGGFKLEEGIWAPMSLDELYEGFEDAAAFESLNIKSDGITMGYYPVYVEHEGPLYHFELSEDGSFWADYSRYPDWPANEGLPSRELLFRIKS